MHVDSAQDLLPFIELQDITTFAVVGIRKDEPSSEGDQSGLEEFGRNLEVMARRGESTLEARVRMTCDTAEAEIMADVGATYTVEDGIEVSDEAVSDFLERVAVMAIFPYLRESVFTTASRLQVSMPVIGLLRLGEFAVGQAESQASTEEDAKTQA